MFWKEELSFRITPKSGPVRQLDTLLDANRAITQDLPRGYTKKAAWSCAGWTLHRAGETGEPMDIRAATEALVEAIESEGWMERHPEALWTARLNARLRDLRADLAECIASASMRRRPNLRLISSVTPLNDKPVPEIRPLNVVSTSRRTRAR